MLNRKKANRCIQITFTSDGYHLKGTLHLPPVPLPPVVIGSHGLLSNCESPKQLALAHQCSANGIAFFRFDHRGCGNSQGCFSRVTTLKNRINDLTDAIKTMRAFPETGNRLGLFGSSLGGAVSIAAFADQAIDALVTVAAPTRIDTSIAVAQEKPNGIDSSCPSQTLPLQFDISNRLAGLHHILIFHGDADSVVPYAHAVEIFLHAKRPKRLIRHEKGDHRMSRRCHQQMFIDEAVKWYKNCLKPGANQSE
jgi:alpha-beta hydrolase superfamily lysophospholipase